MMVHTVGTAVCQKETHKALIKFDLFALSFTELVNADTVRRNIPKERQYNGV